MVRTRLEPVSYCIYQVIFVDAKKEMYSNMYTKRSDEITPAGVKLLY